MNLGKFAVQAIKKWNPFGPEAITRRDQNKAFRKARRKARKGEALTHEEEQLVAQETVKVILPDGSTVERTEPTIKARTSTKATVGAALAAYPGYQVVEMIQSIDFPWPWLENFTNGPGFVWLCATIIPLVIARFTKSPIFKQAL